MVMLYMESAEKDKSFQGHTFLRCDKDDAVSEGQIKVYLNKSNHLYNGKPWVVALEEKTGSIYLIMEDNSDIDMDIHLDIGSDDLCYMLYWDD